MQFRSLARNANVSRALMDFEGGAKELWK